MIETRSTSMIALHYMFVNDPIYIFGCTRVSYTSCPQQRLLPQSHVTCRICDVVLRDLNAIMHFHRLLCMLCVLATPPVA